MLGRRTGLDTAQAERKAEPRPPRAEIRTEDPRRSGAFTRSTLRNPPGMVLRSGPHLLGFIWLIHPPKSAAFVPVLRTRRNHPTPCSPSVTELLTFTRLTWFTFVTGCMFARPR